MIKTYFIYSMKLKYNSPGDLPLAKYLKTLEIFNDASLSDLDKNIEILAIYADTTVDSILKLRPDVVEEYFTEMSNSISSYKSSNSKRPKKIKINDQVYTINYNIGKLNMAQYIDFQQIIVKKNYLENLPALLSIFIIPKGHKYNDDYDIIELRNILENNITLDEALSIIFFSKMKSISLIKLKLLYYRSMLKIMRWTTKDKQTKEMLRMTENQLSMLESNLTGTYH